MTALVAPLLYAVLSTPFEKDLGNDTCRAGRPVGLFYKVAPQISVELLSLKKRLDWKQRGSMLDNILALGHGVKQ